MPSRRSPEPTAESCAAELMQAIGVLVRRVRSEAGAEGLSWTQAATLGRLDRGGAMTTAELARAEMVKPQSMGTLLAELESAGFVQREPHPTDGRQILFSLTPAGVSARRQRQAVKLAWLSAAIDRFEPDEQRTLAAAVALLSRIGEG